MFTVPKDVTLTWKNITPKALTTKEHGLLLIPLGFTTSKPLKHNVVQLFPSPEGICEIHKTPVRSGNSPKAIIIKLLWETI